MPNIQSAKKKVRKDIRRTSENKDYSLKINKVVKSEKKGTLSADEIKKAYAIIDRAAKRKVIHKNKAARLKSRVSRVSAPKA